VAQVTVAPHRTLKIQDMCIAEISDTETEMYPISSILSQQVLYGGDDSGGNVVLGGGIAMELPSSRLVYENTLFYLACRSVVNSDFSFRNVSLVRHLPIVLVGTPERACVEGLTRVGDGVRWVVLTAAVQQFVARTERDKHREYSAAVRRVPDDVDVGGRADRDTCAAVRRNVRSARRWTTAATAAATTARDRQQEGVRHDDRRADGDVLGTAPPRHGDGRLLPHLVAGDPRLFRLLSCLRAHVSAT
jgi:hypothetical protein